MVRGALVALLELESDLEVVSELERGDTIVAEARRHKPDVAVIDIDLPGLDGLTAAERLHEEVPDCRSLILTSLGRPGTLRRALDAQVGGYLLKDAPPGQLAVAIRKVAEGRQAIDPSLALAAWSSAENPLTQREIDTLRLAAEGAGSSEIADQLHLAVGTIRNYLTSAVLKLHARNRLDAILIAQDAGWLH
uniref:Putative two-component response regulator n=1 Tax=uncultured soil bacterium V167 TaxID=684592 RepID=D3U1V8_9BACT|nr:putative two-component response regulator [uncultured soil bacterium V167]